MFNRVKFTINKKLFQTSTNKESFAKNKKIYNIKNNSNNNFNRVSVRKFSSFSNKAPPNEPNNLFLIAAIVCGTLFTIRKTFTTK
jgi:hypothetical protein